MSHESSNPGEAGCSTLQNKNGFDSLGSHMNRGTAGSISGDSQVNRDTTEFSPNEIRSDQGMLRRKRIQRDTKACKCFACEQNSPIRNRTKVNPVQSVYPNVFRLKKQVEYVRIRNKIRRKKKSLPRKVSGLQEKPKSANTNAKRRTQSRKRQNSRKQSKNFTKCSESSNKDQIQPSPTKSKSCDSISSLRIGSVFSLAPDEHEEKRSGKKPPLKNGMVYNRNEESLGILPIQQSPSAARACTQKTASSAPPQFFLLPLGGKNVLIPAGKLNGKPKAYVYDAGLPLKTVTQNIFTSSLKNEMEHGPPQEDIQISSKNLAEVTSAPFDCPTASTTVTSPVITASPTLAISSVLSTKGSNSSHKNLQPDSSTLDDPPHGFSPTPPVTNGTSPRGVSFSCLLENKSESEQKIHRLKEALRLKMNAVQRLTTERVSFES